MGQVADEAQRLAAGGRLQEARSLLREAVAAAPDDWSAWRALGNVATDDLEWEEAEEAYARAEACPGASRAAIAWGRAVLAWRRGQPRVALTHLDPVDDWETTELADRAAGLALTCRRAARGERTGRTGQRFEVLVRRVGDAGTATQPVTAVAATEQDLRRLVTADLGPAYAEAELEVSGSTPAEGELVGVEWVGPVELTPLG